MFFHLRRNYQILRKGRFWSILCCTQKDLEYLRWSHLYQTNAELYSKYMYKHVKQQIRRIFLEKTGGMQQKGERNHDSDDKGERIFLRENTKRKAIDDLTPWAFK